MKKNIMNKIAALSTMAMMLPATTYAEAYAKTGVKSEAEKVLGIVFVMAKFGGALVVLWGLYDTFIAEDQRNEGKKFGGGMKIAGGIMLALAGSVLGWAFGKDKTETAILG